MGSLYTKNGSLIGKVSNSGGVYDLETAFNRAGGSIFLNGSSIPLVPGSTNTISYTGDMGYFDVTGGIVEARIEALGGSGGKGSWSNNNDPGGPGGAVIGIFKLSPGRYYYFIGEGDKTVPNIAGSGGGSTDIRTVYASGTTFNINDFLQIPSLNSRFIVAGGGGGAHGGAQYGAWGTTNSPGAGGPDRTTTNSRGNNDGGHVNTGANSTEFGLDGGSSIDTSNYTANGAYGRGGWPTNYINEGYTASGGRSGKGWPNGGSGTQFANGGGGGGWYGGATNWPNGGGGSNYIQGIMGRVELLETIQNSGENNTGSGSLIIKL
jgi:hypothetical protein